MIHRLWITFSFHGQRLLAEEHIANGENGDHGEKKGVPMDYVLHPIGEIRFHFLGVFADDVVDVFLGAWHRTWGRDMTLV